MIPESWERLVALPLPPVLLLVMPDGDDAWAEGVNLARFHQHGKREDWHEFPELSAPETQELVRLSHYRWEARHVMVARLDSAVYSSVMDRLLKALEEPSGNVAFILTSAATFQIPPTIISRAQMYRAGTGAKATATDMEASRVMVAQALEAASLGDSRRIARIARDWTPLAHVLLGTWAAEAYTGRWGVFTQADSSGYGAAEAMDLIGSLSQFDHARLRMAMQAALSLLPPR